MSDQKEPTDFADRVALGGRSLREHTARGSIVNGLFTVGLAALGFLKVFMVALFLSPSEYGTWGLIVATLVSVSFLLDLGVGGKFIQQSEDDQEKAFQQAFTLNLAVYGVSLVLLAGLVPLIAYVIDQPSIVLPGLVMLAVLPAGALRSPLWVFYRRMQFVQQRTLQAIEPIVGIIVTVGLAAAGLGYWALVVGGIVGTAASAAATVHYSPYPLALRWNRGIVREYFDFSWPLLFASVSRLILIQAAVFVGEWQLGLAAAGAITIAAGISQFTDRADRVLSDTIYPAVCAVADRRDLLFETFVKSNRLALMWGMPFGIGLALFTPDLVEYILGDKWQPAVVLLQAFGAIAAFNHVGFNWEIFYRARGDTKPVAIVAGIATVVYLGVTMPLLATEGLDGFAIGIAIQTAVVIAVRTFFLSRLFAGFRLVRHMLRAIAPSIPAAAVVLLVRQVETGDRTSVMAIGELVLYVLTTIAATAFFERALLREILGYLRSGRAQPAPA